MLYSTFGLEIRILPGNIHCTIGHVGKRTCSIITCLYLEVSSISYLYIIGSHGTIQISTSQACCYFKILDYSISGWLYRLAVFDIENKRIKLLHLTFSKLFTIYLIVQAIEVVFSIYVLVWSMLP